MKEAFFNPVFVLRFLLLLIVSVQVGSLNAQDEINTVVIDAGHGGHDPGNLGTGRYKKTEKDISLLVAIKLGNYIKETFPKIKVIYTRKDDRFIPLQERANIANKNKADLFISIHCNAAPQAPQASGTETWVMGLHVSKANLGVAMRENSVILMEDNYQNTYADFNPRDPDSYIFMSLMQSAYLDQSLSLAARVQEDFTRKIGRHNRGVKQAGFLVLYKTAMPAILVEMGFLTNKEEEDFLQSDEGRTYIASSIFRAFRSYKESTENIYGAKPDSRTESNNDAESVEGNTNKESVKIDSKPVENEPVENKVENTSPEIDASGKIQFKVQFLTSPAKIASGSKQLKGLSEYESARSGGIYKYTSGSFDSYQEAKKRLDEVKVKFPSAFIVAFKGSEPIAVPQAIKLAEGK